MKLKIVSTNIVKSIYESNTLKLLAEHKYYFEDYISIGSAQYQHFIDTINRRLDLIRIYRYPPTPNHELYYAISTRLDQDPI